jgi:hypothetical protein
VLIAVVVAAVGTASASGRSTRADAGVMARCPLNALRLSLSTHGTATQIVIFLMLGNPERLKCSFSAHVVFEVEQNGHRAAVVGNPLGAQLRAILGGSKQAYAQPDVWWANWCRPRHGLLMTARVGRRFLKSPFRSLPVCLAPHHESTLRLPAH